MSAYQCIESTTSFVGRFVRHDITRTIVITALTLLLKDAQIFAKHLNVESFVLSL